MKHRTTYIAQLFATLVILPFETGFTRAEVVLGQPTITFIEEESPLLDTRVELLTALDARAPRLSEMEKIRIADIVAGAAFRQGVDPFLVLAVMTVESELNFAAKSNRGAVGFMQLRSPTAFEWSDKIGRPMPALGLYDWEQNVELGAAYLRFLRDRMGSWHLALAGYNWGPTKVYQGIRAAGGSMPAEMRVYEKRVNTAYARLTRAAKVDNRTVVGAI